MLKARKEANKDKTTLKPVL